MYNFQKRTSFLLNLLYQIHKNGYPGPGNNMSPPICAFYSSNEEQQRCVLWGEGYEKSCPFLKYYRDLLIKKSQSHFCRVCFSQLRRGIRHCRTTSNKILYTYSCKKYNLSIFYELFFAQSSYPAIPPICIPWI